MKLPRQRSYYKSTYDGVANIDTNQKFDLIVVLDTPDVFDSTESFKFDVNSHEKYIDTIISFVNTCVEKLSDNGTMLVYGFPKWLVYYAKYLDKLLKFKYWIAIKKESPLNGPIVPAFHRGLVLFVKNQKKFTINNLRIPHGVCTECGDFLADWGGKKHLRNPEGSVVSDVWDDRDDLVDDNNRLSKIAISRAVSLVTLPGHEVLLVGDESIPDEVTNVFPERKAASLQGSLVDSSTQELVKEISGGFNFNFTPKRKSKFEKNKIFIGDTIDLMSSWVDDPNARFDLIFADPPYNLMKNYGEVQDNLSDEGYLQWTNEWLYLCAQLLKPEGTLYVLNLPKWTFHHAVLLNRHLHFQQWVVWDALSEPRGKIMPAHYGLLVYSKDPNIFTRNPLSDIPSADLCLRPKCINLRRHSKNEPVSDIWYDVHRIKHRRDRDAHPCQLPAKLLERVVGLSAKPGDVIFDPFVGTGTTVLAGKKAGLDYVGIDIDPLYSQIVNDKLAELENFETQTRLPAF